MTIYWKCKSSNYKKGMVGKAGRPTLHARVFRQRSWIGFCVTNTFVLTAMKGFSVVNETAACTEAFFLPLISGQVSQEQSMFVGSKLLPVLVWASHSAVAGDSWELSVPWEIPVWRFWSEWDLGFGLASMFHFQNVTQMDKNKSEAGCFHFLLIITSPSHRMDKQSCPLRDIYVSGSKKELKESG